MYKMYVFYFFDIYTKKLTKKRFCVCVCERERTNERLKERATRLAQWCVADVEGTLTLAASEV